MLFNTHGSTKWKTQDLALSISKWSKTFKNTIEATIWSPSYKHSYPLEKLTNKSEKDWSIFSRPSIATIADQSKYHNYSKSTKNISDTMTNPKSCTSSTRSTLISPVLSILMSSLLPCLTENKCSRKNTWSKPSTSLILTGLVSLKKISWGKF